MKIEQKIARALKVAGGTHTLDDINAAISTGHMQMWEKGSSVVITELVSFPQYNVIQIVMAVGNLDEVMALQPAIEIFGRENGASRMRMMGREGWSVVLPRYGWKQDKRVLFEKDLT